MLYFTLIELLTLNYAYILSNHTLKINWKDWLNESNESNEPNESNEQQKNQNKISEGYPRKKKYLHKLSKKKQKETKSQYLINIEVLKRRK